MTGSRDIIAASDRERIWSAPDGHLIYAIGDIHGRADLLDDLLARIADDAESVPQARSKTLIFLGDYIDRGPASSEVVETLLFGLPAGFDARFIKGNHEAMLLGFLEGTAPLMHWLQNGGDATLESYGVDICELDTVSERAERLRQRFAKALPRAHRVFFESLELMIELGDYLFVHAGIRPGKPLDQQDPQDLLWIREEFGSYREDFGRLVVHGHTSGPEPIVRPNRICIDTHAWFSGRLTALRLYGSGRELFWTSPG
jgi:serine/threonine protein phosphatase 1